jgi:hypothetical protein
MLVQMTLKAVVNIALQCGGAGIPEHPDRDLTAVVVPSFGIDEDFDVAGASITRHDAGDFQVGRGFACGFNGDLSDRTNGKTMF